MTVLIDLALTLAILFILEVGYVNALVGSTSFSEQLLIIVAIATAGIIAKLTTSFLVANAVNLHVQALSQRVLMDYLRFTPTSKSWNGFVSKAFSAAGSLLPMRLSISVVLGFSRTALIAIYIAVRYSTVLPLLLSPAIFGVASWLIFGLWYRQLWAERMKLRPMRKKYTQEVPDNNLEGPAKELMRSLSPVLKSGAFLRFASQSSTDVALLLIISGLGVTWFLVPDLVVTLWVSADFSYALLIVLLVALQSATTVFSGSIALTRFNKLEGFNGDKEE